MRKGQGTARISSTVAVSGDVEGAKKQAAEGEDTNGRDERNAGVDAEKAGRMAQARLLDDTAERLRQEGAKNKDMTKRHTLFGAAAGLEIAACALRDNLLATPDMDAAKLLARYRATRIDYLIENAPAALPRRRPPKLNVSNVVKSKGSKK